MPFGVFRPDVVLCPLQSGVVHLVTMNVLRLFVLLITATIIGSPSGPTLMGKLGGKFVATPPMLVDVLPAEQDALPQRIKLICAPQLVYPIIGVPLGSTAICIVVLCDASCATDLLSFLHAPAEEADIALWFAAREEEEAAPPQLQLAFVHCTIETLLMLGPS